MKIVHFPGNVSWKIPLELQFRTFHIPWLQKNYVDSYAKVRIFSSSTPVRYIPKNSSKPEESRHSSPLKDLEEKEPENGLDSKALRFEVSHTVRNVKKSIVLNETIENQTPTIRQSKNQMPGNSFLFGDAKPELKEQIDHEFADEPKAVFDESETYEGNGGNERHGSQAGKSKQDAENSAIKLLAKRAFTAVELGKKLQGKKFPHYIIEAVINDFQSRGLINDSLYAETFSRSRWSSSSWGPRRIKHELVKKGVSEAHTETALKLVFQDSESCEDHESRVGMSKLSMDQLFVQASKQWLRCQDVPLEKQKSRIIRWLQYRGFNWGVISFILKKLESQYPP